MADFECDPLVFHGRFPVHTGAEVLRAIRQLDRDAESALPPLLVLQGTADRLCDAEGSRELYRPGRHRGDRGAATPWPLYVGKYSAPGAQGSARQTCWAGSSPTRERWPQATAGAAECTCSARLFSGHGVRDA